MQDFIDAIAALQGTQLAPPGNVAARLPIVLVRPSDVFARQRLQFGIGEAATVGPAVGASARRARLFALSSESPPNKWGRAVGSNATPAHPRRAGALCGPAVDRDEQPAEEDEGPLLTGSEARGWLGSSSRLLLLDLALQPELAAAEEGESIAQREPGAARPPDEALAARAAPQPIGAFRAAVTPAVLVSSDGSSLLVVPSLSGDYLCFSTKPGIAMLMLGAAHVGLSSRTSCAAVIASTSGGGPLLLLADCNERCSAVVAVDHSTLSPVWRHDLRGDCSGLGVCGDCIFISDFTANKIYALRMLPGGDTAAPPATVARVAVWGPTFIACSGCTVFLSACANEDVHGKHIGLLDQPELGTYATATSESAPARRVVFAISYIDGQLGPCTVVPAAGESLVDRPMAVVQARPGSGAPSYLVIGELGSSKLLVLALGGPNGPRPVGVITLPDEGTVPVALAGLAAHPSGESLVVVFQPGAEAGARVSSGRVLPWPPSEPHFVPVDAGGSLQPSVSTAASQASVPPPLAAAQPRADTPPVLRVHAADVRALLRIMSPTADATAGAIDHGASLLPWRHAADAAAQRTLTFPSSPPSSNSDVTLAVQWDLRRLQQTGIGLSARLLQSRLGSSSSLSARVHASVSGSAAGPARSIPPVEIPAVLETPVSVAVLEMIQLQRSTSPPPPRLLIVSGRPAPLRLDPSRAGPRR